MKIRNSQSAIRNSSHPYQISISNEQRVIPLNRRKLRQMVERTLRAELVQAAEISVAIVGDACIHEINREYLGHNYPTDVISFLLESFNPEPAATAENLRRRKPQVKQSTPRGSGKELSGEIIISAETALRESRDYGWNPVDELSLYLVHGLLHLCGYEDLTNTEQRVMRARETEILAMWKLEPHYGKTKSANKSKIRNPKSKMAGRSPPARR